MHDHVSGVEPPPLSACAATCPAPLTSSSSQRLAAPQNVALTNPADALIARADTTAAFGSLFLALGTVALVAGGVGIANVMVIAVLERCGEIGLRRALGARCAHIAIQFFAESALLATAGGTAGRRPAPSPRPCTRGCGSGTPSCHPWPWPSAPATHSSNPTRTRSGPHNFADYTPPL